MVKIITPYVNDEEIKKHKNEFWEQDVYYEKDETGIGSDLMFQKMWKKFPDEDIFILHADMSIADSEWFDKLLTYVDQYPEAGMFGCTLLYPSVTKDNKYIIQSAGGRFTNEIPDHFGSGLVIETGQRFKELEIDEGQYDYVREVAWTTFGGCYIRRSFINAVGDFDPNYEWTYNRDVDYCLAARKAGKKIYQIPVKLFHHESRDNKRIKTEKNAIAEQNNLIKLKTKWGNSKFYKSLDKRI